MLQAFLDHPAVDSCRSLQRVICSGEALSAQMQSDVFSRLPWVKLYNLYGPTEAAIDVTHWTCVDNPAAPSQSDAQSRTHGRLF